MADQTLKEHEFCSLAESLGILSEAEAKFMRVWIEKGMIYSPYIWQDIISKIGNLKFVDGHGYDFDDFSEAKTSSLTYRISNNGYKGRISNVGTKKSYLRVAIFNEFKSKIEYFLIPPDHICKVLQTSYKNSQFGIDFSYDTRYHTYSNNLERYQVSSIEEACRKIA